MPRLLIASDCGFLPTETVARTLEPALPDWPTRPDDSIPGLERLVVPEVWHQALTGCEIGIYASESREHWERFSPRYVEVGHGPGALFEAAFDAGVNRFIFISSGRPLGYERYNIIEEWDGTSCQERIDDPYENWRGQHLPNLTIHGLYLWYLHKRQDSGFLGFLARPPLTELIWLWPQYAQDPEYERSFDPQESLPEIRVDRYRMHRNYDTSSQHDTWQDLSPLDALERLCHEAPAAKV